MREFASILWETTYQGPLYHKLLAWYLFFFLDHSGCMNLSFKATREPGDSYKFSGQIFPFSFSNQVHHRKFSFDAPEGWKVYFCWTYSLRVIPLGSQLSVEWSSRSLSHLCKPDFFLSHVSSEGMKNQSSYLLCLTNILKIEARLCALIFMSSLTP